MFPRRDPQWFLPSLLGQKAVPPPRVSYNCFMPFDVRMQPWPFKRTSSFFAALIILWALLTFTGLCAAPLFDYDEAAHAQTAAEMLRDGKWLLPTMNGRPFHEKPAFLFYFISASFTLFGENAFAARLPSALFTLATGLYLYYLGRRIGNPLVGTTASLIYLSMLMPALLAHAAILDAAFNFWIAASVLSFVLWQKGGRRGDAVLSLLAAGVAVSVKGPAGAVLPFVIIALDRLAARDFTNSLSRFPWQWGIPAFLAGALPWYTLVTAFHGFGFLKEFILIENVHRFMHAMEGHGGGWYYYLLILIPSSLPWIAWLPWWVRQAVTRRAELGELDRMSRMSLIWTMAVIALFSLSQTKLPHYISSIYPAIALGISAQWHRKEPERRWIRAATLTLVLVCIPLVLALLAMPELYSAVAGRVKHPRAVAILTQGFRPDPWIPAAGAVLFASLLVLLHRARRAAPGTALTLFILFGLLLQTALIWSLAPWAGRLMQEQPLEIAAAIRAYPHAVPVYSLVNSPSISFYSGRSYREVNAGDLERLASSSAPYLLVARTNSIADISSLPLDAVVREKDFVLLRNALARD